MKYEHKIDNEGLFGYLKELISSNRLEDKESGIAKLAIDKGCEVLSPKQRYVFDKIVENYCVSSCSRCGSDIPWPEMLDALDNGGLCGYCRHVWERMETE